MVDAVLLRGQPVVDGSVGPEVPEAVPLARRLRIELVEHVILSSPRFAAHLVLDGGAPVQRGIGQGAVPIKGKDGASPDEAGRPDDLLRVLEKVEAAEGVVVAPEPPRRAPGCAGSHRKFVVGGQAVLAWSAAHGPESGAEAPSEVESTGKGVPSKTTESVHPSGPALQP